MKIILRALGQSVPMKLSDSLLSLVGLLSCVVTLFGWKVLLAGVLLGWSLNLVIKWSEE